MLMERREDEEAKERKGWRQGKKDEKVAQKKRRKKKERKMCETWEKCDCTSIPSECPNVRSQKAGLGARNRQASCDLWFFVTHCNLAQHGPEGAAQRWRANCSGPSEKCMQTIGPNSLFLVSHPIQLLNNRVHNRPCMPAQISPTRNVCAASSIVKSAVLASMNRALA